MSFQPYDPDAGPQIHRRNLPHWRQSGTTYFVTFRLADSLPTARLEALERLRSEWLTAHGLASTEALADASNEIRWQYAKRFNAHWHALLDTGFGDCVLRDPEFRQPVVGALEHWHGTRMQLGDCVIMPNHVHALITPDPLWNLSDLLHSIKRFSARAINQKLNRKGALWQDESFDHIVRSEVQLHHFQTYIRNNPVTAKLKPSEYWLRVGTT